MSEQLTELYERNDKIERELNSLSRNVGLKDDVQRKELLLAELNVVIEAIEKLEEEEGFNDR